MLKLLPGFILASAFVLSACGGGASNSPNANPNGGGNIGTTPAGDYTGPPAGNDDITNFKIQFFDNVRGANRCGNCHSPASASDSANGVSGSAGSDFADNFDVNRAYGIALGLVDQNDVSNSALVQKFTGSGHFCWEGTQEACRIQLELWISNWINGGSSGGRSIALTPPADTNPTPIVPFDPNVHVNYWSGNSGLNIHNIAVNQCIGCHNPSPTERALPANPQFGIGPANDAAAAQISYDALIGQNKLNITTPELSRIYLKIRDEGHKCWEAVSGNGINCDDSAAAVLNAIYHLKTGVEAANGPADTTELDSMLKSRAVELFKDGIVASGGSRYEANQIALYEFKTGTGSTILDVSGVTPAMPLELTGIPGTDYEWQGSYGMRFMTGAAKAQSQSTPANKIRNMVSATGEYSIEMWLIPGSVAQDNSTIVSYEFNSNFRNFMVGQDMYAYESYNRNSDPSTTADASPRMLTDGDDDAQTALQHVVVTYDQTNGRQLWVNGTVRSLADPDGIDDLTNWATDYSLVIGNDTANGRAWNGVMKLLAIHNRAMTQDQIRQNFDLGVGQKYYLMFEISEHLPQCQGADPNPSVDDPVRDPDYDPLCFLLFEAAQFDDNSFLFAYPRFVTLSDTVNVDGIVIKNIRIGVNGKEALNGQGFARLNVTLDNATFDHTNGQQLSNIGTIVAAENGAAPQAPLLPDQFFLTFEQLGTATPPSKDYTENFPAVPDDVTATQRSAVSIRNFEQINATMAAMTTIPRTTSTINQNDVFDGTGANNDGTYTNVIQALPSSNDPITFVSSNQMAITQLAIEYCNALADNVDNASPAPRDAYFPGVPFSENGLDEPTSPDFSFSSGERDLIIEPLLAKMYNVDGATELSATTMIPAATARTHLNTLIDTLTATAPCSGNPSCGPDRTRTVIKATCAAALAGAPMLLQ